ncbi:SMI1/KNR4 family protein [Streptomyces sp. Tu 2975]|uniref:SMI1/KNR4 family protein n=1 Tax=Streptomyces sp. Tu 2975 TaxID=2676871 RepID=UPI0013594E12|nr:SMI1/KNR4 family protein [Streptomyces sp. Tu 2975]QIP83279.1 SMI1/KNR4 family protein [Streptomyces sp. Tu 2975]
MKGEQPSRPRPHATIRPVSEELSRWYRGRLVGGQFRPFDPGECTALEREVGLPLPPTYRSFLTAAGGERPDHSVRLPACAPEPVQSFDSLYQLGRDEAGEYGWGTLLGEYRHSRDGWLAENVPLTGLLPIARNGGSDVLFLDLNPATHGQLHAFVHAIAWPEYLGDHVFTKAADNFDAYLDSLFIDPDMAEDAWADVAESDPSDPWRRTVEEWLDKELPTWRAEAWATPLT